MPQDSLGGDSTNRYGHGFFQEPNIKYAVTSRRGDRRKNEDFYAVDELSDVRKERLFAVYDGHFQSLDFSDSDYNGPSPGYVIAEIVSKMLPKDLKKTLDPDALVKYGSYQTALEAAYEATDKRIWLTDKLLQNQVAFSAGACAVTALVTTDEVIVAIVGDCKAVLSEQGIADKTLVDTKHKVSDPLETQRILRKFKHNTKGPSRDKPTRVAAREISRAFGDYDGKSFTVNAQTVQAPADGDDKAKLIKRDDGYPDEVSTLLPVEDQAIISIPQITTHKLTQNTEFLVLSSDGLRSVLKESQQIVDIVRALVLEGISLRIVCNAICGLCINPPEGYDRSQDNITIMVVAFFGEATTEEQWREQIRAKNNLSPNTTAAVLLEKAKKLAKDPPSWA